MEPLQYGSFRVNFRIQLEPDRSIFKIENNKIAEYIAKYLDYIVTKLPGESDNTLKTFYVNVKTIII